MEHRLSAKGKAVPFVEQLYLTMGSMMPNQMLDIPDQIHSKR